jgi:hypothetical protein
MRKLLRIIASGVFLLCVLSPAPALAGTNLFGDSCNTKAAKESAVCQKVQGENPLTGSNGLIIKITRIIAFVAGAAAVVIIILSGLQYINSGGDATKATQARNGIIYALVGLIVIISAQFIIGLVISRIN